MNNFCMQNGKKLHFRKGFWIKNRKDNPDIVKVYPVFASLDDSRSDVRRAIIRYMEGL